MFRKISNNYAGKNNYIRKNYIYKTVYRIRKPAGYRKTLLEHAGGNRSSYKQRRTEHLKKLVTIA